MPHRTDPTPLATPVVRAAEQALRAAGVTDYPGAVLALANWHWRPTLHRREVAAILAGIRGRHPGRRCPVTAPKTSGRVLAWTALLVALAASVAANVAFAQPHPGPRLSAGVAPVLVVLAAGLLERVPLAGVRWWRRLLAYGGLSVVVTAAFVTSFEHQYRLLLLYGNPALSAVLLPIAVDGLIVLASVCLTVVADRRRSEVPEPSQAAALGSRSSGREPAAAAARKRQPVRQVRRPVAESRQLLRELLADDPATPTDSLARSLGVSERRVRSLLAAGGVR